MYTHVNMPIEELYDRISELFEGEEDLVDGLKRFVPRSKAEAGHFNA